MDVNNILLLSIVNIGLNIQKKVRRVVAKRNDIRRCFIISRLLDDDKVALIV